MEQATPTEFVRSAVSETKVSPKTPIPTPDRSSVGTFNISDDMPLSLYEENNFKPFLMDELKELQVLWDSNIVNSKQRLQEIDAWIKEDMIKGAYKMTIGAYKEYLQSLKQQINYSSNRIGIDTLDQLYFYLKNISHLKARSKKSGKKK